MKGTLSILGWLALIFFQSVQASTNVRFVTETSKPTPTQVIFVNELDAPTKSLSSLNDASNGQLMKLLELNTFVPDFGNIEHFQLISGVENILVVGTKQGTPISSPDLQNLGGKIAAKLSATTTNVDAQIHLDNMFSNIDTPSALIASGYYLRNYSFDKYKTEKDGGVSNLTFVTPNADQSEQAYNADLVHVAAGVHMARDFATEPGKSVYPEVFVDKVKQAFKGLKNIDIEVLDVKDMEKLNMGALMGVGKGSINDPRLLIIEYMGGGKGEAPIALAGKGITFDTGGISIKGNSGMWAMKSDLSGAAAVAGTMYAIAQRGENINVVGLMALAENMPSQDAIRPGDVLETMKGTTIEIMSTDAEGRLVLSDAVYYAQQEYNPKLLLNIATLTGSAARALSDEYAALITRDFDYSTEIMEIGKRSGEHVWPLPLHPNHFEQIKSPIADIKNSGAGNPGASIGAAVIGTFVDEDLPWIHLDIAGVDWLDSDIDVAPKGSQGWGVRFMDQLIREHAAK